VCVIVSRRLYIPVVDERIHEYVVLDDRTERRTLVGQISIVVVRYDDAVEFRGQPQNVPIVVAHHALTADFSGRGENQHPGAFQFRQDILVYKNRKNKKIITYNTTIRAFLIGPKLKVIVIN